MIYKDDKGQWLACPHSVLAISKKNNTYSTQKISTFN